MLEGDPGATEDEKLLERGPSAAFLETDPWRALRILSEFVEGFDAMARVGPAVTVFGSARTKPDDPVYELARTIGGRLAEAGYAVITGGGPGTMEAANRGCREGGRPVGRLQHRAAARAGHEPVRRPRRRVPLLLRPQGDVREVRRRLRDPARRLRHAGRAVRGADPDPDRQGPPLPGRAGRPGLLGGAARLDPRHPAGPRHRRRERPRPLPRHRRPRRGRRAHPRPSTRRQRPAEPRLSPAARAISIRPSTIRTG